MAATRIFRARAAGFMDAGARPNRAMAARYPDAPACPTEEYNSAAAKISAISTYACVSMTAPGSRYGLLLLHGNMHVALLGARPGAGLAADAVLGLGDGHDLVAHVVAVLVLALERLLDELQHVEAADLEAPAAADALFDVDGFDELRRPRLPAAGRSGDCRHKCLLVLEHMKRRNGESGNRRQSQSFSPILPLSDSPFHDFLTQLLRHCVLPSAPGAPLRPAR